MEENVLKDFETFKEFPNKNLKISSSSNYYFVRKKNEDFVTKRNIDSISTIDVLGKDKIIVEKSYFNVLDGSLVLKTRSISDMDGKNEEFFESLDKIEIIRFSSILNIKGNSVYYLTKDEIEGLINYKECSAKTYKNTPKKNYF